MPRLRLGVVLLVRGTAAIEIDGLRRACGDRALARIAPHLTLVPPVNVRVDAVPTALAVLREAAASTRPIELTLGPPETFSADSPTLHLHVDGRSGSVDALVRLRDLVFRPPLERSVDHTFVPHVTLADGMDHTRLTAAIDALADYRAEVTFDRVHILEERDRKWEPVADVPFTPRRIVGRGGLPLELTVSELVDPEAGRFEEREWANEGHEPPQVAVPAGARMLVITARREREGVVGVARGRVLAGDDEGRRGDLRSIIVATDARGEGVAGHLRAAFESAALEA